MKEQLAKIRAEALAAMEAARDSAELDALRQQIQEGSYRIDADRIAANILLWEQE